MNTNRINRQLEFINAHLEFINAHQFFFFDNDKKCQICRICNAENKGNMYVHLLSYHQGIINSALKEDMIKIYESYNGKLPMYKILKMKAFL